MEKLSREAPRIKKVAQQQAAREERQASMNEKAAINGYKHTCKKCEYKTDFKSNLTRNQTTCEALKPVVMIVANTVLIPSSQLIMIRTNKWRCSGCPDDVYFKTKNLTLEQ
jgi:hypothetical protein